MTKKVDTMTYDHAGRTLEVGFKNGAIRRYYKVPARAYATLRKAFGTGSRLDESSRQGMYPMVTIREPESGGTARDSSRGKKRRRAVCKTD
jgi:hypothetical protein